MLSTSSPTQGPHLCVKNGDFNDSYNGQAMHFAKDEKTSTLVQIDHVVAVQDAWASGLWQSSRAGSGSPITTILPCCKQQTRPATRRKGAWMGLGRIKQPGMAARQHGLALRLHGQTGHISSTSIGSP